MQKECEMSLRPYGPCHGIKVLRRCSSKVEDGAEGGVQRLELQTAAKLSKEFVCEDSRR